MLLPFKITAYVMGVIALITLLFALSAGIDLDNIIEAYGFLATLAGIVCTVVAITFFATGKKDRVWAKGFLLSAVLLLLTGLLAIAQLVAAD